MDTLLSQQPETYSQLIKRSLTLYRKSFIGCILFSCLFSIVTMMPQVLSFAVNGVSSPHPVLLQLWITLLHFIALFLFIAIIWHMHCVIRNTHEPLIEDIYKSVQKIITVFLASVIVQLFFTFLTISMIVNQALVHVHHLYLHQYSLGILLSILLLIGELFLFLYTATLFSFFIPLIAIENKGIFSALKQSSALVWNHWWRAFSVQMTPWFYYFFSVMIVFMVLQAIVNPLMTGTALGSLSLSVHVILFVFFIPWIAALQIVQLKDLELRKK